MSESGQDVKTDDTIADLSILRRPIKTSMSGLKEARKAYDNGTEEVRQLLANECDLIYECKVCRNVFRSLVNFISHKRIYCKGSFKSTVHFDFHNDGHSGYNQDLSTIVQAEKKFINATKSGRSQEKDLSSIIERLVKREKANQMLKLSDFYEQVSSKLTQDEIMQKKHVLQLDAVPDSNVAVYQTIKTDSCDSIKTEISEINDLIDAENTVLGPDGKIVSMIIGDEDENGSGFECEICKNQYATQKTLKLHIKAKHIPSTYVYQCPSCSKTFLQVKAVIRHLTNDHKKSMRRVRLMRDSILRRRIRIDEVQVKGPSRELSRLQTCQEKADARNKAWLENLDNIDASVSINVCTFCGKRFDRRVVLLSHSKICQQKHKSVDTTSLTKKATDTNRLDIRSDSCLITALDESSNSNSIDTETCLHYSSTVNKRKKKRVLRVSIKNKPFGTDDENDDNEFPEEEQKIERYGNDELEVFDDENKTNSMAWDIIDDDTRTNATVKEIKREMEEIKHLPTIEKCKAKDTPSSNCKYCNKNFSNPSNLRRHITMLHVRQRKFYCLLCEEFTASRKTDVIQHIHTAHEFSGKKTSVVEYISEKEVTAESAQPTQNRRKDKHIALLKDDEVQVILEPSDVTTRDGILFPEVENGSSTYPPTENIDKSFEETNSCIKRKGRPKNTEKSALLSKTGGIASGAGNVVRRPVRNRTMPVKKDFVYDLSNLLKKDVALYSFKEHHPTTKVFEEKQHVIAARVRNASISPITTEQQDNKVRNSIQSKSVAIRSENMEGTEKTDASLERDNSISSVTKSVKGAADLMANQAVNSNRAIFSKIPKLPTERQQTRALKHKSVRPYDSIGMSNWPILKRPIRGGYKPKTNVAVKNIRHTLKRRKNHHVSSRPEIYQTSSESNGTVTKTENESPQTSIRISSKIADKIQMRYEKSVNEKFEHFGTGNKSIEGKEQVFKLGECEMPKRRMTLLERLAQNKTRKMQESMSKKQNILKRDDDSDDDD